MNSDKSLGLGLIVLGIAGIWQTMQIDVFTFSEDPGPKLFPILGFSVLVFCGAGILLFHKRKQIKDGEAKLDLTQQIRGLTISGLLIAYSLGLWLFGYYLTTPILTFAFYYVIAGSSRRVWWRGVVYSAAVTAGVHLLFSQFLNTLLPSGILF